VHLALTRLAARQLFVPRWNEGIINDLRRMCGTQSGDAVERYIAMLCRDFEDAMSRPRRYVTVGPFPVEISADAQHVLQAVVTGQASTILTTRPADFPDGLMGQWGIVVQDIDDFLCSRLQLHPRKFVTVLENWISRNCDRKSGPPSMAELLETLSTEVPNFGEQAMAKMDSVVGNER
jgi:hypothetical protein